MPRSHDDNQDDVPLHLLKDPLLVPTVEERALLQATFKRTNERIEELKKELRHLESVERKCAALIPPIRRLSPWLLAEMLYWAVLLDGGPSVERAIKLSSVCVLWRTTVCTTAKLWSTLLLYVPFQAKEKLPRSLSLVNLWGTRSAKAPLYLTILGVNRPPSWNEAEQREVANTLIPNVVRFIDRWKTIRLDWSPSATQSFFEACGGLEAPLLTTIDLQLPFGNSHVIDSPPVIIPRLLQLRLKADPRNLRLFPQLHQLRRLELLESNTDEFLTVDTCVSMLHNNPTLKYVEANILSEAPIMFGMQTFPMPSLEEIDFWTLTAEQQAYIFDHISVAPLLRVLTVSGANARQGFDLGPSLLAFIRRSSCTLTSLSLCSIHIEHSNLVLLFGCQPSLLTLSLNSTNTTDETLQALHCFLPMLSALRLRTVKHVTGNVLVDLLAARGARSEKGGSSPSNMQWRTITNLTVHYCNGVTGVHRQKIRRILPKAKLDVQLTEDEWNAGFRYDYDPPESENVTM